MLKNIIEKNQSRILNDLKEIKGIKNIDFVDIFPESEEHRKALDEEVRKISTLIDSTEKGNFYLLNEPILTHWGDLKFLKIRFFDETRLGYEAAPDFEIEDWNELKRIAQEDNRFKFIERAKWKAIEFKTNNCLVYFLNPLVTTVYGIEK